MPGYADTCAPDYLVADADTGETVTYRVRTAEAVVDPTGVAIAGVQVEEGSHQKDADRAGSDLRQQTAVFVLAASALASVVPKVRDVIERGGARWVIEPPIGVRSAGQEYRCPARREV